MIKSKAKSLRTLLYEYLVKRRGRWVNGGELEKYAELFFYKGSTGARRLRELNHDGFIHSQKRPGKLSMVKSVWVLHSEAKEVCEAKIEHMKKIHIEIEHNLTPFHEEVFNNQLRLTMLGIQRFWDQKSKKTVIIKINDEQKGI